MYRKIFDKIDEFMTAAARKKIFIKIDYSIKYFWDNMNLLLVKNSLHADC